MQSVKELMTQARQCIGNVEESVYELQQVIDKLESRINDSSEAEATLDAIAAMIRDMLERHGK